MAAPITPVFHSIEIDRHVEIGYGLAIADVDGDKNPDVLLADKHLIVWYQHQTWEKHIMAENLTPLDHVCLAASDIDGDGKAEVAVGAGWNPGDTLNSGAVFYLIPPPDRTQRWGPVRLPHEPTVHRMRWVQARSGKSDLVVVPLHGRGNKSGAGAGVRILAYQMPANPKQPWTTELIDDSLHLTHNFVPVQWDTDEAQEIIVASKEGLFLFDRGPTRWEKRPLAGAGSSPTGFQGAGEVRFGKLPGGQAFLATVEPMHGNQVAIYTAGREASKDALWSRQELDASLIDGHAVVCADFANSGSDQLVVGWRAMGKPDAKVGVRLYMPLDSGGREWNQTMIDDNGMACEDLAVADLDGDGRLDLIAAGRGTKNLKLYMNETPPR